MKKQLYKSFSQSLFDQILPSLRQNSLDFQLIDAVVAVIFVENQLFLTKRSSSMPSHKGQIGFIGGYKAQEEEEFLQAVLRELKEESGMDESHLDFLGAGHAQMTQGDLIVLPYAFSFKGKLEEFKSCIEYNDERDFGFLVDINTLMEKEKLWNKAQVHFPEKLRKMYFRRIREGEVTWFENDAQRSQELILWGLSAKILQDLWSRFNLGFNQRK